MITLIGLLFFIWYISGVIVAWFREYFQFYDEMQEICSRSSIEFDHKRTCRWSAETATELCWFSWMLR